jgi:hypothetical protein
VIGKPGMYVSSVSTPSLPAASDFVGRPFTLTLAAQAQAAIDQLRDIAKRSKQWVEEYDADGKLSRAYYGLAGEAMKNVYDIRRLFNNHISLYNVPLGIKPLD